jgi:hypothetical protein
MFDSWMPPQAQNSDDLFGGALICLKADRSRVTFKML